MYVVINLFVIFEIKYTCIRKGSGVMVYEGGKFIG